MTIVIEILNIKGNEIRSIDPASTIFEALEKMAEYNVGALMVIKDGKLVGIFTERDYARSVVLKSKSSRNSTIEELMHTELVTVGKHDTINECMNLMTENRVRHLPVLEEDKVIGLISIGDVVKQLLSEQAATIRDLKNYISGSY